LSRQVVDDFGVDFDYDAEAARWHRSSRNARKLREYTAKTEVNWIAARRPGKALLVLDLDHTLLDFTNAREGWCAKMSTVRGAVKPHARARVLVSFASSPFCGVLGARDSLLLSIKTPA
jgi:hypothetical protein